MKKKLLVNQEVQTESITKEIEIEPGEITE